MRRCWPRSPACRRPKGSRLQASQAFARSAILALTVLATSSAVAQRPSLSAPNRVEISPGLVTAGQPSADMLARLGEQGFQAVIYLAPPTVSDAVRDEALIVGRQGLVYVNIPIRFDSPSERDFEVFAAILRGLAGRKVLVHCQINLRASTMVFLYRAIIAKEDPRMAYETVSKVWTPEGPWKRLVQDLLRKHKIEFEPF